jgi:tetratricopeptide (TPR) repeat protein
VKVHHLVLAPVLALALVVAHAAAEARRADGRDTHMRVEEVPVRGSLVVDAVPRAPSAAQQRTHAESLVARLESYTGRERLRARLGAIEALRRVRDWHPASGDDGARAALAAALQLGVLGLDDEALAECDAAVRLARDDELHAAARFERAHAARRSGAFERACDDYRWCAAHLPHDVAVGALLRLGDVELARGDALRARAAWEQGVDLEIASSDTIDVFDRLARDAFERGDREAAAAWLDACARSLGDALRAHTPTGTTLRRALLAMRTRHELACDALERAAYDSASHVDDE